LEIIKLGLPTGSLKEPTLEIFRKAGYRISQESRSLFPYIDDENMECTLIKPQEIPLYIQDGILDVGITGKDWMEETGAEKLEEVAELTYSRSGMRPIRLVLAVPVDSDIYSLKELEGKKIATELVNVTRQYLMNKGIKAQVVFSWGSTEVKPPRLADAISELTETGQSLKANRLRVLETVLTSTPRVVVNNESWKNSWKKKKIENMVTLLRGALKAEKKVALKMNISEENLKRAMEMLPALRRPTVSSLYEEGWVAVETIVEEKEVKELICQLKEIGAEGILEYSLNKIIP